MDTENKKKSAFNLLTIFLVCLVLYIFLSTVNYYINYFLIIILIALNFILGINTEKINKDSFVLMWLIFASICCTSLFSRYSTNVENSIIFIFCLLLFLISYINLTVRKNFWPEKALKIFFFFSAIFAAGTIVQIIFPDMIEAVKKFYVQKDKLSLSNLLVTLDTMYGGYNGLVVQTGTNAFLLSIFIGVCLFRILNLKSKFKYLVLIIVAYILLMLTGKRTLLISSVISLIIVVTIFYKFNPKYIIAVLILLSTGIFMIFNYTNIADKIVEKFMLNEGDGVNLSGREELYEEMYSNFKKSPLIGVGIDSKVDGDRDGHNIYLQVMSETGIFGVLILIVILVRNFLFTTRLLMRNSEFKNYFAFSLYIQIIFTMWGLTGNTLYDQFVLISYFLSMAISTFCYKKIKQKGIEK